MRDLKLKWFKMDDELITHNDSMDGIIFKVKGGYEYKIIFNKQKHKLYGNNYDSLIESSNGNDHARTIKEAKQWVNNTMVDFIEESGAPN